MTSVAPCSEPGLSLGLCDGRVAIDRHSESALEYNLDEYNRAGFPELAVRLIGDDIPLFCEKAAPLGSEQFAQLFRRLSRSSSTTGRLAGPRLSSNPLMSLSSTESYCRWP